MKTDRAGAGATLILGSYVANVCFWGSSPNELTAGADWADCRSVLQVPAPGDQNYNDRTKKFRVRIDFRALSGTLWVDDVQLPEVEMLDE